MMFLMFHKCIVARHQKILRATKTFWTAISALVYTSQANSAYLTCWLACSEVINTIPLKAAEY